MSWDMTTRLRVLKLNRRRQLLTGPVLKPETGILAHRSHRQSLVPPGALDMFTKQCVELKLEIRSN